MKIAIAQLNPTVGAVKENVSAMLQAVESAKAENASMVIFPELAVPGYPPKDLLFYNEFVAECLAANDTLAKASENGPVMIWGNIATNPTDIGKPLMNAGYIAVEGKIIAKAQKANLPTYDVFDEARYFEPADEKTAVAAFDFGGRRIALTICEDLWSHPCFAGDDVADITPVKYEGSPLAVLKNRPAHIIINLSASPYVEGKPELRYRLLGQLANSIDSIIVYANQVGANDDLIFDGSSVVTTPKREQRFAKNFDAEVAFYDLENFEQAHNPTFGKETAHELISALTLGIKDYVHKSGFKKVFLGLSGGIDSSLTAVLATRALGKENVIGVAMPGPYSSDHSLEDAELLAQNLGIECRVFPISHVFDGFLHDLSNGKRYQDLAEQNLQARLRGLILMTYSNREQGLVLTTCNKSEIAMGFSTMYGDVCGALGPLGDLLKTQVYALSKALNTEKEVIPKRVLEKAPSAELAPNQKDEDTLPPYDVLDKILKEIFEEGRGFGELLAFGYDEQTVSQIIHRLMIFEYKRRQMPPVLKVSPKAFGSGRIFPIVHHTNLRPQSADLGVTSPHGDR